LLHDLGDDGEGFGMVGTTWFVANGFDDEIGALGIEV